MVDPTDKDTKHIKDRSTVTEGYLEYTKENEKEKNVTIKQRIKERSSVILEM